MTALYNSPLHTHTHTHTHTSSPPLLGSGFQRRTFPFPLGSQTVPFLIYQLLTTTATTTEPQQFSNLLTQSLTKQPTQVTLLTLLLKASRHGPCRKHRSSVSVYGPLPSYLFRGICVATGLHATIYTNSVRTSQETYYVSAAKTNRLMLFRETVSVHCENHTEHTNTLCGQNAEF
jgi:hypothetical protein